MRAFIRIIGTIGRWIIFLTGVAAILAVVAVAGALLLGAFSQSPEGEKISLGNFSFGSPEETLIGFYLRLHQAEIERPASDDDTPVTFVVQPGETAGEIASRLAELGLVTDAELFRLFMRYHGVDANLEAGEYTLRPNMTMAEIAEALQQARLEEVEVTIPEGWRSEEIADMLERENIMDGDEFLRMVREGTFDYDFLADRPSGATLEGYLFPDTYRIPAQARPQDLIQRMLDNFGRQFTPQMRQDAAAQGLTVFQVVVLASIVEREAVIPEERPIIASVYLNRLEKGMYLQADPTVQYAKGYDPNTGKWWNPMQIEEADTVDSPYNTFQHPGLPPGPICNPGLGALQAVVYPADTNYLFFFSKGDGSHAFAETYEEHLRNQERYQR